MTDHDEYVEYPEGDVQHVYSAGCEEARTHQSGYACRNTNNHDKTTLKKSCLGVVQCERACRDPTTGSRLSIRPAIDDKAREKQLRTF